MLYNLRKKINLNYFNIRTNDVRKKARIKTNAASSFKLATLLCNSDVNMYLLAVSSFCRYVKPKEIIVISDRLSEENCEVLKACVDGIRIVPAEDFREDGLPVGGCWERLTYILRSIDDAYMVQLDADTLTLKRPDEVIDSIQRNVSFSITTKLGFEKMSFVNASYLVWERESRHVQNEAEKIFKTCRNADSRLYVRACAGFSGYAKSSFTLDTVKDFSWEIEKKIGKDKWSEWGSEQVASNYVIANSAESVILPYEYYPFYEPGIGEHDVKLFHFIGTHRFKKGRYLALARQVIDSL